MEDTIKSMSGKIHTDTFGIEELDEEHTVQLMSKTQH